MDETTTAEPESSSQDRADIQAPASMTDPTVSTSVSSMASGDTVADAVPECQEYKPVREVAAPSGDWCALEASAGNGGQIRDSSETPHSLSGTLSLPYLRVALTQALPGTPRLIVTGMAGIVGLFATRDFLLHVTSNGGPIDTSVVTAAVILLVGTTMMLASIPSIVWTCFVVAKQRANAGPDPDDSRPALRTAVSAAYVGEVVTERTAPQTRRSESNSHQAIAHHSAHIAHTGSGPRSKGKRRRRRASKRRK